MKTDETELGSYVYVLTNPAMPGLVKIGRTDAADPEERAKQLYTTGVPVPFVVEFAGHVDDPQKVEQALQTAFEPHRVNPKREFFRIEPAQAIAILDLFDSEDVTTTVAADLSTDLTPQERQAGERLLKRRPQLNFDEMSIAHGSELVYVKDDSLRAVVVEAKKVSFEGEIVALSVATKQVLGTDYYVAPTKHWLSEGRSLQEIYDETYPPASD